MSISKLGVLGAGAMGAGIAQVGAQAGLEVTLADIDIKFVEKAIAGMKKNWDKSVSKGKLDEEEARKYLNNIKPGSSNQDLKDCELVIEVIVENIDIKKAVFKELNDICSPDAVIASNTSGFSITEIAAASGRPDRVVGMHFFNPVPVMKLVEVIPGTETSEATMDLATENLSPNRQNTYCSQRSPRVHC